MDVYFLILLAKEKASSIHVRAHSWRFGPCPATLSVLDALSFANVVLEECGIAFFQRPMARFPSLMHFRIKLAHYVKIDHFS